MELILKDLRATMIIGLLLAALLVFALASIDGYEFQAFFLWLVRWIHVISGIMWVGLLYYFNFVQIPNMGSIPDEQKPAIGKIIAPAALWWFRWYAMSTIVAGLLLAYLIFSFEIFKRFNFKRINLDYPINLVKDLSFNVLYLNKFGNSIFVSGMKNFTRKVAVIVDGLIIDGSVNFVSTAFGKTSRVASATQTGLVRSYVVYFGLFLLLLIGLFIITPMVPQ